MGHTTVCLVTAGGLTLNNFPQMDETAFERAAVQSWTPHNEAGYSYEGYSIPAAERLALTLLNVKRMSIQS